MSEEAEINSEKTIDIELNTDRNNSYEVKFTLDNSIEIIANQINDIIHKSYSSKYSFEEIKDNEYFLRYDALDDIFDELKERIYSNQIIIIENENNLRINIPLSENNEIIFELRPFIKNNNERLNELTELIIQLKTEMNNIQKETNNLNDKYNIIENNEIQLKNENEQLKIEIDNMKNKENELIDKNTQIINDINELKNEKNQLINQVNELKNENIQLKNNESQFINEITNLKNEITELKEKLNILWEENKLINNLDSKKIKENEKYNLTLKNWINPSKKIKAELLYRLSEKGDEFSTFHKLWDNKGPTLTLFHVNDGNIIGIYTPLSWDSISNWKNDIDTFIFNLNKNLKCKKLISEQSIYCNSSYGPTTARFGYSSNSPINFIKHWANEINKYYDKGSEILPSNNEERVYELIETEIYKIMIE